MLQKWKDSFSKTHFNIEGDSVNMLEYHHILHWYLIYTGLTPGPLIWQSKGVIIFVTLSGAMAYVLCMISLAHAISQWDLQFGTEAGTYLLITVIWMIFLLLNLKEKPHFLALQNMMIESFDFVKRKGKKYRKRYFDLQLLIWKGSFVAQVIVIVASSSLIVQNWISLTYYSIKHIPGDGMKRTHIFPVWLPSIEVTETPYYEVLILSSYIFLSGFGIVLTDFMVVVMVWVGQMYVKTEMVVMGIRGLLEGILEPEDEEQLIRARAVLQRRMRDIVQQHYDVYSLIDHFIVVYKKLLMYHQFVTVPITCMTAFVFAESIGSGDLNPNMVVVFGSGCVALFFVSYIFTVLIIKLSSVIEECGAVELWTIGEGASCVRTDLQLVMMRALRPPTVRCAGFREVSLETFATAMASAYSYFNMLRQMT